MGCPGADEWPGLEACREGAFQRDWQVRKIGVGLGVP